MTGAIASVILDTVDTMRPTLAVYILAFLAIFVSSQYAAASAVSEYPGVTLQTDQSECDPETNADEEINALHLEDPGIPSEDDATKPLLTPAELENFDIPVVLNEAVNKYIRYFSTDKREIFERWLRRARRYTPVVTEILKKHGLPEDLVYLAMIESGFNLKAFSRAKACGPWQFMNETGQQYGLRVNYWVDERRDLEKSTVAAARYLKVLFDQFGDWQLAAAGYNAGEGRVGKAIEKHDTNDFWKLRDINALPKETREYVPQIFAAAIIAKDPEKFGFTSIDTPTYEPTKIRVPGGMSLKGIADAGDLPLTELKLLNPEMLKGVTPPNRKEYILKLPANTDTEDVSRRLQATLKNSRQIVGIVRHAVKKKDSLQKILKRYSIQYSDLALLNDDGEDMRIKRGKVLYIPRFASLRSKGLLIAPLDDTTDEITEMPAGREHLDKPTALWQEDDDREPVTVRKTSRSADKSTPASASRRLKTSLKAQRDPGRRQAKVRVASKEDTDSPKKNKKKTQIARKDPTRARKDSVRLARNDSPGPRGRKVRLTSHIVKKSSSPRSAVKAEKQHPRQTRNKAVPHKNRHR